MVYEEVRRMVQGVMPSAVETFEEDLRIFKEYSSRILEDLANNELSLDVEASKVGRLTCAKVEKEDVPWRAELGENNNGQTGRPRGSKCSYVVSLL
jgi:hypothetical protein